MLVRAERRPALTLFPTRPRRAPDGRAWILPIHLWMCLPEKNPRRRRLLWRLLTRSLRLSKNEQAKKLFQERADVFLNRPHKPRKICVRIGAYAFAVEGKCRDGHFYATVEIPENNLPRADAPLPVSISLNDGGVAAAGQIPWGPEPAFAVVSDLDDTLRIAGVRHARQLLRTTFLQTYEAVPGMASWYRALAERYPGVDFYYVSASPWQLFLPLSRFLAEAGFPDGVFFLKNFRIKSRTFFSLWQSPEKFKRPILENLLAEHPRQKFILVGDAGEKDPEIYGAIARQHPDQVEAIYIRELETAAPGRYAAAFAGVPETRWRVFKKPEELLS
jgi:phosphatidate phosphatase APP1